MNLNKLTKQRDTVSFENNFEPFYTRTTFFIQKSLPDMH